MVKKINIIIICIITLFCVSGCSIKSPRDLIEKPKSSSKSQDINNAVSRFLGNNYTLTLPKSQREKEAVMKVDIDGDGKDELIVLYKTNKNENENETTNLYGVVILKYKQNKWHEINKVEQISDGIDLVQCKDITGDKMPEIFIGWNSNDKDNKDICIYSYDEGYFHMIEQFKYKDLAIDDINNDKHNEVILFKTSSGNNASSIDIYNFKNDKLSIIDKFAMNTKSYDANIIVGNISPKSKGIFVRFYVDSFNLYTNLLIMQNNKLTKALKDEVVRKNKPYIRDAGEIEDINNDGILEMAFLKPVISKEDVYNIPQLKTWYKWNGKDNITLVKKEYYNYDGGYKIEIPDKWREKFSIEQKFDKENKEYKTIFYIIDNKQYINKSILSIQVFTKEQYSNIKNVSKDESFIFLGEKNGKVFVGSIFLKDKQSKYFINEKELKHIFHFISKY
ncbi:hypothetical protein ACFIJ5_05165 [Haloimpatiens sp. FM7330]|uniref:hypothetical protein n=1 Tax=Haloimpatiens sp. FM7330 TaxID=3298610 RepID=UPI003629C4C4